MSSLLEQIATELGPRGLSSLGAAAGATPDQTQSMFGAALPVLVNALSHNANTGGAAALATALDRNHGPALLETLAPFAGSLLGGGGGSQGGVGNLLGAALGFMGSGAGASLPAGADGAGILGHILGAKRTDAEDSVAQASGVDAATVGKFLLLLAPVVMSALGSLKAQQSLDEASLPAALANEAAALGGGGSRSPQDDGFGLDDVVRGAGLLAQSGLLGKLLG